LSNYFDLLFISSMGDPVPDSHSGSLLHFPQHCRIENFIRSISISHSHRPIFTTLGEMTDADNVMNPQHFGSNPADIRIRIRINPEIPVSIPDHFGCG